MYLLPEIVIFGMDSDDQDELLKYVPREAVRVEEQQLERGMKGEPMIAMVVLSLSAVALKAWIAYLIFRGKRSGFEQDIEKRDADGSVTKVRIRVKQGSSADVKASVLSQLTGFGITIPTSAAEPNSDPS